MSSESKPFKDTNRLILSGKICQDAETSEVGRTKKYKLTKTSLSFPIKNEKGINFIDCVIWGDYGEKMQPYLTKDVYCIMEGHIKHERWQQGDVNRAAYKFNIDNIQIIEDPTVDDSQNENPPEKLPF